MDITIFYSWQSDTRSAANRSLIQKALEGAATEIREDVSVDVEPVVDRDTLAVAGAPDIATTILDKIDRSQIFVADVTIVNSSSGDRPMPNPNVLVELGYALKSLGIGRVILVQNIVFGLPENLPFDLRQKRVLTYSSPVESPSRAKERTQLRSQLRNAISLIASEIKIQPIGSYQAKLIIKYNDTSITSRRHDYELDIRLKNSSPAKNITEWHVDAMFPTP